VKGRRTDRLVASHCTNMKNGHLDLEVSKPYLAKEKSLLICMENKKNRGQFYTVKSEYILEGLPPPPPTCRCVIEPFAGKGDLIPKFPNIEAYDIEPKAPGIIQRDTLRNPPNYTDAWVITNPPYLARNKCADKSIFDLYSTNDLYKCFIWSLCRGNAAGGIMIIPAGFFLSPRNLDSACRKAFMSKYKVLKVKYFEETVFPDTPTTVVAVAFERSDQPLTEQQVEWIQRPTGKTKVFTVGESDDWIIGGSVYKFSGPTKIRRYVEGQKLKTGEHLTGLWLTALDSGTAGGRIKLEYRDGDPYPAKDTSRTYATLTTEGRTLTVDEQKKIAAEFNTFIENLREETWSLFLPQYRESKEYARKRIPFDLAYSLVAHLLNQSK
jgi:hypothetical protein